MITNYKIITKHVKAIGPINVIIDSNNKVWFIGIEISALLGYKNHGDAIYYLVPKIYREKIKLKQNTLIGKKYDSKNITRIFSLISKDGLIQLLWRSRMDKGMILANLLIELGMIDHKELFGIPENTL